MGVSIIRMPPQFWNWANVKKIVKRVGNLKLLKVDKECLNLDKVDLTRERIIISKKVQRGSSQS